MAVTRPAESVSVEGLLPGVFPVLSIELYGFMLSQPC